MAAGETGDESISEAGPEKDLRVFLFGVGRDKLEAAVAEAGIPVEVVNELRRADAVLTTKTHYRRGSHLVKSAESAGTPVYVLRKNTMPQVQDFLHALTSDQPERYARDYQELIRGYVAALQRTSSIFRRL